MMNLSTTNFRDEGLGSRGDLFGGAAPGATAPQWTPDDQPGSRGPSDLADSARAWIRQELGLRDVGIRLCDAPRPWSGAAPHDPSRIPIRRGVRLLGWIEPRGMGALDPARRAELELLGRLLAAELELAAIQEAARSAARRANALSRYVPGTISERIGNGLSLEPGECDVTVLFVDLRDFTAHATHLGCFGTFRFLNRYSRIVSAIVCSHGGTVVEFNGDGMMVLFGPPDGLDQKERAAASAALSMVEAVGVLMQRRTRPQHPAVRVGVASGRGFVGDIVCQDRRIWSAVGSTTNLASRLHALARDLDVAAVLDEPTWRAAGPLSRRFVLRPVEGIRGFPTPMNLYVMPHD